MRDEVYVVWLLLVMKHVVVTFLKWGWLLEVSVAVESFLLSHLKNFL